MRLDTAATSAIPPRVDYVGFEVPDVWVIGYGLDDAGRDGRVCAYVFERDVHESAWGGPRAPQGGRSVPASLVVRGVDDSEA